MSHNIDGYSQPLYCIINSSSLKSYEINSIESTFLFKSLLNIKNSEIKRHNQKKKNVKIHLLSKSMSGLTVIMIGQVAVNRQIIVRVMSFRMYFQCNKMIVMALNATLKWCRLSTHSARSQIRLLWENNQRNHCQNY